MLFNLVGDMPSILISRARERDLIKGLIPDLVDGGLSILQYADDMILFLENDMEQARNLKLVLCSFEKLPGLKINFHKSELLCFGEAKEGTLPFTYLGIPMNL